MTKELVIAPHAATISVVRANFSVPGRKESDFRAVWIACLWVAATACGCASSGVTPQYYEAKSLPYELQAKPVENAKTVDLSRLAVAGDMSESIDTDDVLEVTIVAGLGEKDSLTFPMRIQPNGAGNIPGYGPLQLAGLDMPSAEETIAAAIVQRGLYRAPHVTVTMKRQRMNKITVLGGVMKEGVYNLPRKNSNLLAAIEAAIGSLSRRTVESPSMVRISNRLVEPGRRMSASISKVRLPDWA